MPGISRPPFPPTHDEAQEYVAHFITVYNSGLEIPDDFWQRWQTLVDAYIQRVGQSLSAHSGPVLQPNAFVAQNLHAMTLYFLLQQDELGVSVIDALGQLMIASSG